jgi:hypothetical protein
VPLSTFASAFFKFLKGGQGTLKRSTLLHQLLLEFANLQL